MLVKCVWCLRSFSLQENNIQAMGKSFVIIITPTLGSQSINIRKNRSFYFYCQLVIMQMFMQPYNPQSFGKRVNESNSKISLANILKYTMSWWPIALPLVLLKIRVIPTSSHRISLLKGVNGKPVNLGLRPCPLSDLT